MAQEIILEVSTDTMERYRVGKFVFLVDWRDVTVFKDSKDNTIRFNTINIYTYESHEKACDAAWKMAYKQSRA